MAWKTQRLFVDGMVELGTFQDENRSIPDSFKTRLQIITSHEQSEAVLPFCNVARLRTQRSIACSTVVSLVLQLVRVESCYMLNLKRSESAFSWILVCRVCGRWLMYARLCVVPFG